MPNFFQQTKRADHIGFNKGRRAINGTVDVAFGSKVDDSPWPMFLQERLHPRTVAKIPFDEDVPGVRCHIGKRVDVAGIRQFVEVDDRRWLVRDPLPHKLAANETGSAGYEDRLHGILSKVSFT